MNGFTGKIKENEPSRSQESASFETMTGTERRSTFLRYLNRGWLVFGLVTLVTIPLFPEQRPVFTFLVLVIFPTYAITWLLLFYKKLRLAGIFFTLIIDACFYGLFIFLAEQLGAENAFDTQVSVWMLMGLAVLFAGSFVDKWAAPILAFINTVLLIGTRLTLAPNAEPRPSAVVFWWMLALTIWLYERTLDQSFKRLFDELSERRRVEAELHTNEAKYKSLLEKVPGVVILHLVTHPRRDVYVSPAIEGLLGYTQDEWMNDRTLWRSLLHPDDIERVVAEDARTDNTGESFKIEYRMRRKDGNYIWVSEHSSLITDEMDAPLYWQCLLLDTNDRKNAEYERENLIAELTSKNAELERFVYTVSHDLKSPLVTINGFLGYLAQDAAMGNMERLNDDSHRIKEAVYRMQKLLDELLKISRVGRMINDPEMIPFNELIKEALEIVHGRLAETKVNVHSQPDLAVVYGDRARLVEVIQNLVDNAAKYMDGQIDPQIEIGQRSEEDGMPIFFIKDNGIGVPSEYNEYIFGLFNKLNANSEGTGVGLALVKRIIEFHGGRIWVESEAGAGSTFLFTLPTQPTADSTA